MGIDCLCTGILFSDIVCSPVDRVPDEGKLVSPDRIELSLGGCAGNAALDLARLVVNVGVSGCGAKGRLALAGRARKVVWQDLIASGFSPFGAACKYHESCQTPAPRA